MGERAREYQGDSLIGWHISRLLPDTSHLCRSPWQGQEDGRALEGCWQEFQGLLGFGWDTLQTLLALSCAPTALGLLPKHDCPSSGKRKWAPSGMCFPHPQGLLCPVCHPFAGRRGEQSPCTGWEKALQTFPRWVLGAWVALLACGVLGSRAEPRWHLGAHGSGRAAIPQVGNTPPSSSIRQSHCLSSHDSICPYQLITSANEPGVFNLPFISPQVGAH